MRAIRLANSSTPGTDTQGLYNIADLRPGIYSVTFSLAGFKADTWKPEWWRYIMSEVSAELVWR